MTCDEVRELLWDHNFGLLEPGQSRRVAEHLERCAECARALEGLRELLGAWDDVPAPPGLTERALKAAWRPEQPAAAREVEPVGWHVVTRWLVAAGVLAAVVLSGVYAHVARLHPRPLDVTVIAPRRFRVAGPMVSRAMSHGAVRVLVSSGGTGTPVGLTSGSLRLLYPDSGTQYYTLSMFDAERSGMAAAEFTLPGGLLDALPERGLLLSGGVVSELGEDAFTMPVALAHSYRPLLESDRYSYRPGETVRVRGVLLNQVTLEPQPGLPLEVRLLDTDGQWLATTQARCSRQGLFGAELALPTHLSPGKYRLAVSAVRSVSEQPVEVVEARSPTTEGVVELHLEPERSWYRPGETVDVTVRVRNPRGEPIVGGDVQVRATERRSGQRVGAVASARTDSQGRGTVSLALPEVLPVAGEDGDGSVLRLEAQLTSDEGPFGIAEAFVGVSLESVRVAVRPEAGVLVPEVENLLYVLVTRADGAPASAQVTLTCGDGASLTGRTDDVGLASLAVMPSGQGLTGTLAVQDDAGYERLLTLDIPVPDPAPTVLVRPGRWYGPSDEPIPVTVLGPKSESCALVDVSLNGQLALARSAALTNGVGHVDIELPENSGEMLGVLELRGYLPGASGPRGSVARRICVGPAEPMVLRADLGEPREGRLTLSVSPPGKVGGPVGLSVAVAALPDGSEDGPAHWMSRYLLGDSLPEEPSVASWLEGRGLGRFLSQATTATENPDTDRLTLALLGTGDRLLPEESFAAGAVDESTDGAVQVKRTYPEKVASVARTQARFLPLMGTGLWVVACGLVVAGLAALAQTLRGSRTVPLGGLVAQTAVTWAAGVVIVLVVVPLGDSSRVCLDRARAAEAEGRPEVLLPALAPTFAAGEGPIALPRARQAGREPKVVVWEPDLQTDISGVAQLELPPIAARKRLRVSVLAVANGRVAGATVILGQDTPARTAALSPIALPSLFTSDLRRPATPHL